MKAKAMMTLTTRLAAAALLLLPAATFAQSDAAPDNAALLKRIEEQEKRIEALERALAREAGSRPGSDASKPAAGVGALDAPAPLAPAAAATAAAARPAAGGVGAEGFTYTDGLNQLRLRGNIAVDGRWYSDRVTAESADTWLLRRARPDIQGTFARIYDFRLLPDFGNGKTLIMDAWVSGRFQPWFALQAGKFKAPVGLERQQLEQFNRFLEVGLPSALLPYRDLGLQASGEVLLGALAYAFGVFDGVTDGNSTDANASPDAGSNDGRKEYEGRLFARPFTASAIAGLRGLGFGIGGTWGNEAGTPAATLLSAYRTPGQQSFFTFRTGNSATYADGRRYRLTPQFYYYAGSLGVLGEYARTSEEVTRQVAPTLSRSARLSNSAWQLAASWFLTGELASYNGFVPLSPFEPAKSGWGALELVARLHQLRVDKAAFADGAASFADPTVAARAARAIGIGVNWYLNQKVKWMFDYERTRFDGGAKAGDRPDENALLTRFNLVF
jgi:phosphate-selective porin OprO/OprP